jgi:hypothetical protein
MIVVEAIWNTDTGQLWVQTEWGGLASFRDNVTTESDAYSALAEAGYIRNANFLIVPGVPHYRKVEVRYLG